ncbi:methyltransferase domain-containing protein [soil metagenome]
MATMIALDRALDVLACPLCGGSLERDDGSLRCQNGHSFDIARQGYVSFTTGGGPHFQGDTSAMIAARDAFLAKGHYSPIVDAISSGSATDGWCVELAGGTGYYVSRVLDAAPQLNGITLDVSKHAAKAASRTHPRLASITGDVYATLPIRSASIDLVLSVFGPRRGDEIARILAPGGSVVVVTPRPSHLIELRERFGLLAIGADKEERLRTAMSPLLQTGSTVLEYRAELSHTDVADAIMMGPNAFHQDRAQIEARVAEMPPIQPTTISVTVTRFASGRP